MKFDYKPKTNKTGSLLTKRLAYIGLGFTTIICLVMTISLGNRSAEYTTAKVIQEKSENEKLSITSVSNPDTEIKISKQESSHSCNTDKDIIEKKLIQVDTTTKNEIVPQNEDSIEGGDTAHTIRIRAGDTLVKIFKKHSISTQDLQSLMSVNRDAKKHLATLKPGKTLQLSVNKEQQLKSLKLDIAPGSFIVASKVAAGFKVERKEKPLDKQLAFSKGAIRDSLFSSAKRAGLDHNIINQFVEIFGWNIDFAFDLQPKDTFRVLYEDNRLEGERVKTGPILAAEIVNEGKKHIAIRYTDKNGHTAYFSPDGYGMHQAFLRTPVTFTRISSNFGMRNHPILHKLRRHTGVDYSAPVGTPVKSAGDGKVTYVGKRGGYGNVIELQHGPRYTTLYAHLSKFAKGLKCGTTVSQGQIIGYVGKTGLATGAHLHYEFRIDGIHRDPLTVALPKRNPLSSENKKQFLAHAKNMLRLMDQHENQVGVASAQNVFSTSFIGTSETSQVE